MKKLEIVKPRKSNTHIVTSNSNRTYRIGNIFKLYDEMGYFICILAQIDTGYIALITLTGRFDLSGNRYTDPIFHKDIRNITGDILLKLAGSVEKIEYIGKGLNISLYQEEQTE